MKFPKNSTSSSSGSPAGRRQPRREPRVSRHARRRDRKAAAGPGLGLGRSSGRSPLPGDPAQGSSGRRLLLPQEAGENDPMMSPQGWHLAGYLPRPPLRRLPQGPTPVRGGYGKGLSERAKQGAGWGDPRSPGPTRLLHGRGGIASPTHLGALGGHARVVPRSGATVVVHEEGPAGLRVDLDLPARWQGVSVTGSVAGRHLHHGRLGCGAHAGSGSARGAELGRG